MKLFSRLADNTQISQNSVDRSRNNEKVNINNKNYTRQIQLAVKAPVSTSSEARGQIVGARESLNGRKNMAQRKVKNGEKSTFLRAIFFPPVWVSEDVVSKDGEDWA